MALATGQITIVDLTDLPSLQGYLISNLPKIQFLNTEGTVYSPNWVGTPLTISAEVYAVGSGENIITDPKITSIKWYKNGVEITASGGGITLNPSATGNLRNTSITIDQNLLTSGAPTLKIAAEVLYQHAASVSATPIKIDIDYGLAQQGGKGEKGEGGATGLGAISAILSNEAAVLPADAAGEVSSYAGASTTLTVYEGGTLLAYDAIGTANGRWKITPTTTAITLGAITDSGEFATISSHSNMTADAAKISFLVSGKRGNGTTFSHTVEQTLSKARTGAAGADVKSVVLSGPQVFQYNEGGTPTPSSVTLTATKQNIPGTAYVWTYGMSGAAPTTALNATNMPGTTFSGDTVKITAASTGWGSHKSMTVKVAIDGVFDTYTIYKVQDGVTARALNLGASSNVMTFDVAGAPKPASQTITFTAAQTNLSSNATFTATPYNAAGTAGTKITLGGTGNSRTLTQTQWVAAETQMAAPVVRVVVSAASSNPTGYNDTVTVVKLQEAGSLSGYLTNESITVPADKSGNVIGTLSTLTAGTFEVYLGTVKQTTGVTYAASATGGTATINSSTGAYSVTGFTNAATNTVTATLTATVGGSVITKVLTVSKSKVGASGKDAVFPVVWAPDGEVFKSVAGATPANLTATCDLFVGGAIQTSGVTYQWFIQDGSTDEGAGLGWQILDGNAPYTALTGGNTKTLTIPASAVPSLENFKCKVTYNSVSYYGTITFSDMTDPYQVAIISPQGNTFFNGSGVSKVLEAIVYQGDAEVDAAGTALTYSWSKYVGGILQGTLGSAGDTKKITVVADDIATEATYVCVVSE